MQIDLMVRELKSVVRVWRELGIDYTKRADREECRSEQRFLRGFASGLISAANSVAAVVADYEAGTYTPRNAEFQTRLAEIVGTKR